MGIFLSERVRFLAEITSFCVILSGCASSKSNVVKDEPRVETRVALVEECLQGGQARKASQESAVLLAAFATFVITEVADSVLQYTADAIRKAGEGGSKLYASASTVAYMYEIGASNISQNGASNDKKMIAVAPQFSINQNFDCIVIARGNVIPAAEKEKEGEGYFLSETVRSALEKDLGVYGDPEFMYEASVVFSPEGSNYYRIVPRYLFYNVDRSYFSSSEDISVQIDISSLDEKGVSQVISSSVLTFSDLDRGDVRGAQDLKHKGTDWFQFASPSTDLYVQKHSEYVKLETDKRKAEARKKFLESLKNMQCPVQEPEINKDQENCYQALLEDARRKANALRDAKIHTLPKISEVQGRLGVLRDSDKKATSQIDVAEQLLKHLLLVENASYPSVPSDQFDTLGEELKALEYIIGKAKYDLPQIVPNKIDVLPVTVSATVNVIKDENKFLTELGAALGANKEKILEAAKQNLDPSSRKQKENEIARQVLEDNYGVEIEAKKLEKIDSTTNPVEYLEQEKKLRLKILDANEYRRQSGLRQIY